LIPNLIPNRRGGGHQRRAAPKSSCTYPGHRDRRHHQLIGQQVGGVAEPVAADPQTDLSNDCLERSSDPLTESGLHFAPANICGVPLFGQQHVERYRATDGAEGHDWQGTQTLLLTTTGRRSGVPRTTPLIYSTRGDAYTVVASKGGSDTPPSWYLNLSENPEVEVQVKAERFRARARTASAEEKSEMWKAMAAEWPDYDTYQQKTAREIPVVVLEPI
jgi:deazaflavin-dependent oxidoreductase (nitroreductase family)